MPRVRKTLKNVKNVVSVFIAILVLWSLVTCHIGHNGSILAVGMKQLSWQIGTQTSEIRSHSPPSQTSVLSPGPQIFAWNNRTTFAEKKERKYFQAVANTTTFVYSAYANGEEIRIIAIKARNVTEQLVCHLWYDVTAGKEQVFTLTPQVDDIPENHEKTNTAAFIHCKLPKNSDGHLPVAVSISHAKSLRTAENALPVQYLGEVTSKFTLCISPLNNNYSKVHQLVESIEFNRILGADKIVFYNYSASSVIHRVLQSYRNWGLVDIHPWNLPTTKIHYHGQLAAINDCLYQYRNRSQYLVYQDLDEFIIPQGNLTSWGQLLQQRKMSNPKAGIFLVRNVIFQKKWLKPWVNFTLNKQAQKYQSIVLQNTLKENQVFEYGKRSKFILDPWVTDLVGIHFVWKRNRLMDKVPQETALLCHYRGWNKPKDKIAWSEDVSVVQRFGKTLVNALDKAWSSLSRSVGLTPDSLK